MQLDRRHSKRWVRINGHGCDGNARCALAQSCGGSKNGRGGGGQQAEPAQVHDFPPKQALIQDTQRRLPSFAFCARLMVHHLLIALFSVV